MKPIRSYGCRVRGHPVEYEHVVIAHSPGKAKSEFLLDVSDPLPDLKYTDVMVRVLDGLVEPRGFRHNAEYRDIPFARIGMKVVVGGEVGRIVGHNSSANLDVLFDEGKWAGMTLNCHPNSEISYFEDDGTLIVSFNRNCEKGAA